MEVDGASQPEGDAAKAAPAAAAEGADQKVGPFGVCFRLKARFFSKLRMNWLHKPAQFFTHFSSKRNFQKIKKIFSSRRRRRCPSSSPSTSRCPSTTTSPSSCPTRCGRSFALFSAFEFTLVFPHDRKPCRSAEDYAKQLCPKVEK